MASSQTLNSVLQYSYRAQKDLGLVNGPPSYEPASGFEKPETAARATLYSADGSLLALVLPNSIRILSTATNQVHREIQVSAVEVKFSPKATFLSTWERPIKQEDGAQHKNLRVWAVESGEEVVSFTQTRAEGWEIQFTPNESHAVRLSGPELQVFNPSQWSAGVQSKLRLPDGNPITAFFLSPSAVNPSVLVFVPEKKGAPASVRIYNLLTLSGPATCQKTFFKADTVRAKWNQQGTMVLVLTHTDVDKTNKSYYGETGLYLLSAAGNFDSRITLDKEGPVHDFAWNPSSKEFGIVYGFMPAKTTLFDQRVKPVYEFGSNPYNFISWSPQGRFVALAGFGNLQGKIDVFDRKTLNKVSTIDAPNTSCFEWAPSGDVILTAILSPRLRVDNGVKIWYVDGKLLHVQDQEELYQVNWRPFATTPPFPAQIPPCPAPSSAASSVVKPAAVKPAGAYRPPGAQGRAAPSIFNRREDDTPPLSSPNRSGSHTPNHHYNERGGHGGHGDRGGHGHGHGHGHSHGHGANGYGGHGYGRGRGGYGGDGRRYVPGAPPSREAPTPNSNSNANNNNNNGPAGGQAGEGGRKKKNNQKKKGPAGAQGQEQDGYVVPEPPAIEAVPSTSNTVAAGGADDAGGEGGLDPIQKKIRNLNKKLKAIEELKDKAKRGEKLETTQHKKISTEAEIRKELQAILGEAA